MTQLKCIVLLVLTIILGTSCEKEVAWKNNSKPSQTLVVEAVLTNEFKHQNITLSHPKSYMSDADRMVSSAKVSVSNGSSTFVFVEHPEKKGIYISQDKFAASISKTYHLNIDWNNQTYTAQTGMKAIKPTHMVAYQQKKGSHFYEISNTPPIYAAHEQAMYVVDIFSDSIVTEVDTSQHARLLFYTFSTLDVGQVFAPKKSKCWFYSGAQIIQTKYALTDDYAEFIRALFAETEWQGGFFSETSANLPCNIKGEKALGYFTACSVLVDSLTVN